MNTLNTDWEPGFGSVFTWFAMDKKGKIAVMINNGFGDLPKVLLSIHDADELLEHLNEYMWEESSVFVNYPVDKQGNTILDMYSAYQYNCFSSRNEVEKYIQDDFIESGNYSDTNLSINKGFHIYQAIEGSNPGQDYPVGYDGETKMGDYFRYLMPTVYASIDDFPSELRRGIAVSDTIDFTVDRVLDNDLINIYFPKMYSE
ncbi:hypothetical protein BB987_21070 [Photorhabdus temperata]|uniref:Uncharacterized protein n=1 Tax=Photorhabdus khanii NC19 TaxID=1004151 RepID=W3V987_9GAMM|nr:hypothetical protein [Photorhabdus khanii]ETS32496.1 hypothetical protein PTE_01125 [Photorhabdus khanii NC19]OHV57563.1 hypothetical protein BB987_21070 [Photorhabdus temperata]